MLITQQYQQIKVSCVLEEDTLVLDQLKGCEKVNDLYCYTLKMHSQELALDFEQLIGTPLTVEFQYGQTTRYFSGIIGEIAQLQTISRDQEAFYQITLYPRLWLLKFGVDYQIFQNKTAIEIIKEVLQQQEITEIHDKTSWCGQTIREYCVQYGETYYAFICRLMEEEGIFFYFDHGPEGETLILHDDSSSLTFAQPGFFPLLKAAVGTPYYNRIVDFRLTQQVVSKNFAMADYNFETAATKLYTKVSGQGDQGQVYRYPGLYQETSGGEDKASLRIQELEWFKKTVRGTSTAPTFSPMSVFSLTGHPRREANNSYLLYEVHHTLNAISEEETDIYFNEFKAFPESVTYRPPLVTPRPIIASTQTAKVTGKSGEEIWCDEYGRIKVKFHWDQKSEENEKSSCWIRVAQLWAGSQWGSVWTPRVGMEVVVTFLEGNPDRPLITGCVYNSDNLPPYVKEEPTKSTIKSQSSKDGQGGFNELRFEDKKDEEEIYIHAQKDMNTVIEDNRTLTIQKGNDSSDIIAGNRRVTLHGDSEEESSSSGNDSLILAKGSRSVLLKAEGDQPAHHTLELTKGNNSITLTEGDFLIHLEKGDQTLELKDGNQTITIKGTRDMTIHQADTLTNKDTFTQHVTGDYTLNVKGSLTIKVQGSVTLKGEEDVTLQAGGSLHLKAAMDIKLNTDIGDIQLTSTGATKVTATRDFSAQGLNAKITGTMSGKLEGGSAASVTAGGALSLSGATVSIG